MDVQRAVAILKRASENGMYDPARIPEADGDKIKVAAEQVMLARQVETVVQQAYPGWADAQITEKVRHWPAVQAVLLEANVLVGANEPEPTAQDDNLTAPPEMAVDSPAPAPPPPVPDQASQNGLGTTRQEYASPKSEEQVAADAIGQPIVSQGFLDEGSPRLVVPAGSDPEPQIMTVDTSQVGIVQPVFQTQPAGAPDQGSPREKEVWLDGQGIAWAVVHVGPQSAEVKNVASGEGTIVPLGFLKKRHRVASTPGVQGSEIVEVSAPPEPVADQEVVVDPPVIVEAPTPITPFVTATDEQVAIKYVNESDREQQRESPDDAKIEVARYDDLVDTVESRYEPAGMPIPRDLEDPPTIDAEGFADVDDATARMLHSRYNALAARAKYLHDVEDAKARECDLVRMHHMRRAMAVARRELGSSATVTEVKIVAEEDALVDEWASYARSHADEARAFKTFHDIYTKHVEVLSRDWTMREKQVR